MAFVQPRKSLRCRAHGDCGVKAYKMQAVASAIKTADEANAGENHQFLASYFKTLKLLAAHCKPLPHQAQDPIQVHWKDQSNTRKRVDTRFISFILVNCCVIGNEL